MQPHFNESSYENSTQFSSTSPLGSIPFPKILEVCFTREVNARFYLVMKIFLQEMSPLFCIDCLVLEIFQVFLEKWFKHLWKH